MTPPHQHDLFGDELARTVETAGEVDRLLGEAELYYAPTPAGVSNTTPADRDPISHRLRPDRLLLDPIWYIATGAAHTVLGTLLLGSVTLATALLAVVGWLAVDQFLGVPLLAGFAVCVGLLAAGGTVASAYRSFRRSLSHCPW